MNFEPSMDWVKVGARFMTSRLESGFPSSKDPSGTGVEGLIAPSSKGEESRGITEAVNELLFDA